jgi:hypothetical protein
MQPTLRHSDAELLSTATNRLSQSYSALMPGLHIDAEQGIVTISGRVSNRSERCSITQMLRTIPGVQAVVDHIDFGSAAFLSDHRLAKDALAALTASGHMREGQVQVTVRGGIVVLDGTVRWHSMRMAAGACIEDLPGLQGVCNRLNLAPSHRPVGHGDTDLASENTFRRKTNGRRHCAQPSTSATEEWFSAGKCGLVAHPEV